jgi:hypothetical protein
MTPLPNCVGIAPAARGVMLKEQEAARRLFGFPVEVLYSCALENGMLTSARAIGRGHESRVPVSPALATPGHVLAHTHPEGSPLLPSDADLDAMMEYAPLGFGFAIADPRAGIAHLLCEPSPHLKAWAWETITVIWKADGFGDTAPVSMSKDDARAVLPKLQALVRALERYANDTPGGAP